MNINEITTEAIINLDPYRYCSRERVEVLIKRLSAETPFELLISIPVKDAYWFLAHILPRPERVQWVDTCVRRAQEYAEGVAMDDAAYWARWAAYTDDNAAYYAARTAHWAAKVARCAAKAVDGAGIAAQRAEQQLAIRHGLMLLEAL